MSQTSILSYFSKNVPAKKNTGDEGSDADSPVKVTQKKRQRIVSSGSENEDGAEVRAKKTRVGEKLAQFSKGKIVSPTKDEVALKNGKSDDVRGELTGQAEVAQSETSCISPPSSEKKVKTPLSGRKKTASSASAKKTKNAVPPSAKKANNKSPEKPETVKEESTCSDGASYNPSSAKYHPINDASWKHGEKVPYLALSRTLEDIENTSARLKMIDILSNYLRSVIVLSPDDLLASVYLCLNKIGPAYAGLELGLAEQTLIRAISQSTGRTFTQIKNDVQETGDLGAVAERSRSSQRLMFKPLPLTVQGVFKRFGDIAAMSGQAAVNKKISMIQGMFVASKGPEARFLIRSLNGKLRIGLAEQSVLQAIACACAATPPGQPYPPAELNTAKCLPADTFKAKVDELALTLKTTYCECPNYDLIVPVILREGIPALPRHCKINPGIPVKPMLAQPTKGVQEVLTRFDGLDFTCEWKYDGERAQMHYLQDGTIKIYSRNQEDNTSKYPDIISRMKHVIKEDVKDFILDCEAVAWDKEDKRILPFQILSTRKRKDANEADIKVQVCVFMFDLLYLNGRSLIRDNFLERRTLLQQNFLQVEGQWKFATALDTCKMEEVQEFLEESIKGHCEGLMVKTLKEDATYEIAKRSRNWLKLKKDYLEGVGDTLDLVVMGGYFGKGKRAGTYGGFLLGCYDEDSEEYQSLCKIGTGFTDEHLQTHTSFLKEHLLPKAPAYYQADSSLEPDHWFEPVQVWETKCADLSLSPVHRAAIGLIDPLKGISLRFPRFLRIRDDKKPEEATSARQVADMYKGQEQVQAQGKPAAFNEEDFY